MSGRMPDESDRRQEAVFTAGLHMEGGEAGASVCRERERLADEAAGTFLLIVAGTDKGEAGIPGGICGPEECVADSGATPGFQFTGRSSAWQDEDSIPAGRRFVVWFDGMPWQVSLSRYRTVFGGV